MVCKIAPKANEAAQEIDQTLRSRATRSTRLRDEMAAGDVTLSRLVTYMEDTYDAKERIDAKIGTQGLNEHYQDQHADPAYDAVAEINTAKSAMVDVAIDIKDSIPTSAGGYAEIVTIGADGSLVYRTVTPAQTAGFRASIDAFLATVSLT